MGRRLDAEERYGHDFIREDREAAEAAKQAAEREETAEEEDPVDDRTVFADPIDRGDPGDAIDAAEVIMQNALETWTDVLDGAKVTALQECAVLTNALNDGLWILAQEECRKLDAIIDRAVGYRWAQSMITRHK